MELVKGVPITKYCDDHHLTPRERLELFVPVCQAIQHAHQKGIIHRDIKPSNVMVCIYDGKPVPKVIDFGVAKATGPKLTQQTLYTEFGAIVGTFEYMSPEQAQLDQLDIDTRSDIYSLGVLLYELLTGTTPLERKRLKEVAVLELLRLVREEEAPRPSTRLSTTEQLPSIAANRGTEPRKLSGMMRGELDWIVLKALEKDRDRRYETANGLAHDIQRHLHDEPVQACPPSAGYRLKKFVRRNRGPVLAASVVLCCLVGGIAGTSWGLIRATKEAEAARQARDRTRQALDDMTSSITGDSLSSQKDISEDQKKFLSEVLSYYQEFAGEKADDETSRARTAAAAYRVGMIELRLGRKKQSADAFQIARDGYAKLTTEFPAVSAYRIGLGRNHNNLGMQLAALGKYVEADEEYRQAMGIEEKLAADFPAVPEYGRYLANTHHNRADLLSDQGKTSEAEQEYRKALAIKEKLAADFSTGPAYQRDLAHSHGALGLLLMDLGRHSEAEEEHRKAMAIDEKLAADFPTVSEDQNDLAGDHHNLGWALQSLGKRFEAEQEYRKGLAIHEKVTSNFPAVPEYRQHLAISHNNLGLLLADLGKSSEAEEEYGKAVAIQEKLAAEFPAVAAYRRELGRSHNNLAWLLATCPDPKIRDPKRAVELAKRAVELAPKEGNYWRTLGVALAAVGRWREAEQAYSKCLELAPKATEILNNLAWLLATCPDSKIRDPKRAVELAKKAVELTPKKGNHWNTLGAAHHRAGDWKAAIAALEKSMELRKGGDSEDWFFLAMAHWQLGDKKDARKWYDQAVQWMEKNQPKDEELVRFRTEAEELLGVKEKEK
jgi:tetratricopeptide (TPR) repeat protein